ncbi:FIST C-terminal domain-containing protein [Winogradskyella sp. DF17]|uniref:FIST C-terminal domain-containing protein n=1 Tax=Winogradskyella pelagia TaxID=2819984 RepID=A0ABS3T636_9FLAO|nr:FIST N-terminal domain-containing protein [Winogradskyella sp. DF17]MBO3117175.1 FIST C-terminal domain-containing protein [Winogradskyella sp. DF17]
MKAITIKGPDYNSVVNKTEKMLKKGHTPNLAIVFLSIDHDDQELAVYLNSKGIQVFGATTSGEFIDGVIEEYSITLMLLDVNPEYFRLVFLETGDKSSFDISNKLGQIGKATFSNAAFIIASGWLSQDGEAIIEGITEGYGKEVTIFGGMAGDDLALKGPKVFTFNKSSDKGIVALIIDKSKIEVNGIATCGWKPIGTTKTITKSEGNIVYTIDDKPALDMIMKYLGIEMDVESGKEIVSQLSSYYPLQMERPGVSPVMRTAMFANKEDRSLICAGNVTQGAKVRFSLPPDFDAIEAVVDECEQLKSSAQMDADAIIMFSCISRRLSFGVMMPEELEQVQQVWNAPMIGFFSYGEYGKSKTGKHEFHNNTCCVVTLKEK